MSEYLWLAGYALAMYAITYWAFKLSGTASDLKIKTTAIHKLSITVTSMWAFTMLYQLSNGISLSSGVESSYHLWKFLFIMQIGEFFGILFGEIFPMLFIQLLILILITKKILSNTTAQNGGQLRSSGFQIIGVLILIIISTGTLFLLGFGKDMQTKAAAGYSNTQISNANRFKPSVQPRIVEGESKSPVVSVEKGLAAGRVQSNHSNETWVQGNLMWTKKSFFVNSWSEANKLANGFQLLGFNDWRLPTDVEIAGTYNCVEYRCNPITQEMEYKYKGYWTGTERDISFYGSGGKKYFTSTEGIFPGMAENTPGGVRLVRNR